MIKQIINNKKEYLELLLLADEQESMIDKYLERGDMFALFVNNEVVATCVITDEGNGIVELKNIATKPELQRKGYATLLINFLVGKYAQSHDTMLVGTGESLLTLSFYEKCGFIKSHKVKNFFINNYDRPIFEEGVQLVDMVYLKRNLQ